MLNMPEHATARRLKPKMRQMMMSKYARVDLVDVVVCPSGCRCGSQMFLDISIHKGKSIRRDCAECGRFRSFPVWNGMILSRTESLK